MTLCLRCLPTEKPSRPYRLKYPQPAGTPPMMRWEPPGPPLLMCDDCGKEAAEWAEPVPEKDE
jgi:hypothetical protein